MIRRFAEIVKSFRIEKYIQNFHEIGDFIKAKEKIDLHEKQNALKEQKIKSE